LCSISPRKSLTYSRWLLIQTTGVGISSNAVIVVDMTIILPPRACVVVLFIDIVVNSHTIYDHVWKCWYFISADFDRIVHWTVTFT
jgi:hypothetical protein